MLLVTPLNDTLTDKIKELNGICLLTVQNSNYQKESLLSKISSFFDSKEIIKIHAEEITTKSLESFSVNLFEISMFSPVKIFIIEDIEKLKADLQKKLSDILQSIPENTIVILTSKSLAKTHSLYKAHLKNKTLLDGTSLANTDLQNWIKDELASIKLTKYPASLLLSIIEAGESNIDNIKEIIDYLAIYIKDNSITLTEFEKIFPSKTNISDFKILDPIYNGNFLEYMELLNQILKNKNEFLIISIFTRTFTDLLKLKHYQIKKLSPQEIASKSNMQEWLVKKNMNVVSKYSLERLKFSLNSILQAEAKLKDKNLGIISVFEDLFFKLKP